MFYYNTDQSVINKYEAVMPKIVDKEAKKLSILHAAMHVFARQGVVKTKMIDIARYAGVGKGTIYEYFRSKEEIFNSAYQYFFEDVENALQQVVASKGDPVVKLEMIVQRSCNMLLHDGGEFAGIMMEFWAEGVRNKDKEVLDIINLKNIYETYRRLIIDILDEGIQQQVFRKVDVISVAAIFIGALDGLLLQWIMDHQKIDIQKASTAMVECFVNGLKK